MIKKAEARVKELMEQGIDYELVLIGNKGITYFERRGYNIGQNPTAKQVNEISEKLLAGYLSGESDTVELLYTKFVNLISSTPSVRTLVPLSATDIAVEEDEIFQLTSESGEFSVEKTTKGAAEPQEFPNDMIFEQDPTQILNDILPLYINGQVLRTILESVASELAARMNAMQSASDNAKELSKNLTQVYNRARQAAVTQEYLGHSGYARVAEMRGTKQPYQHG